MKTFLQLIVFFLALIKTNASAQTLSEERYVTPKGYNSGVNLTLKPDSLFTFKFRGHISSDTASGYYKLHGDTLDFVYVYNNYDSIFASYKAKNEEVPIDVQLNASKVIMRPIKLLKRSKRLYYISIATGQVETHNDSGKIRKTYLTRSK
jgi:hypothetical protein